MSERCFDYQFTITIPAGGNVKGMFPLTGAGFASYYPFVLRAVQAIYGFGATTIQLRRHDNTLIETVPVRLATMLPSLAFRTNWPAIWPEEIYPAAGTIEVDFANPNGAFPDTVTMLFRGVQLVPDGIEPGYRYPPKYTETAFDYVTFDAINAVATLRDQVMNVRNDADFVLRAITSAQDNNFDTPLDLRILFKDLNGNRHSNVPISRLFLVGNFTPDQPRPFVPPIYLPRNSLLLYDLVRNDPFGAPARIRWRWIGAKIQEVCR